MTSSGAHAAGLVGSSGLGALGCGVSLAGRRFLGVSLRQSHRYASGESAIPQPVVKLLRLALRYRLTADQPVGLGERLLDLAVGGN
jgi:hypothetical protein